MKTGVLLMNTGTADEPSIPAIARYLQEFLMDPAIIGAPYPIRKLIVGHIAKKRPQTTLPHYQEFWTPQGSPFIVACTKQAHRLEIELSGRLPEEVKVLAAMRYGNPSVKDALDQLRQWGATRVVVLPSYPQQVKVCTGTCLTKAGEELAKQKQEHGWEPQVIEARSFHHNIQWRTALARQVLRHWEWQPDSVLLLSFHSTLLKDIEAGDPYRDQVEQTVANLACDLGIPQESVKLCYQSRFDNRKWLQPLAPEVVRQLAKEGTTRLAVVCPGFTAENIESALEIGRTLKELFLKEAGPQASFTYIPCLNDNAGLVKALAETVVEAIAAS